MAMHAGMGLSKVLLLVGAGFTGSIVLRNGRLSDMLAELQDMLKGFEKSAEKAGPDSELNDALTTQVRRLAMEVRQLASARPVTVFSGSGQAGNVTSLIVPAATLGALGYGYMWWKGISFSDLMYVTKRNMANAVSNLTKHLEQVSDALAKTKRHLTQRIEGLDGKLDEQKEISGQIKQEVTDACGRLENIGFELDSLQRLVWGLDEKMNVIEDKQNFACSGVLYLVRYAEGKGGKVPEFLQDGLKGANRRGFNAGSLKGLQHITAAIESGNFDKSKTEAIFQNEMDSLDNKKGLSRTTSIKC